MSLPRYLALAHKDSGRLDRAIPPLERTLAAQTSKLGADHPTALRTHYNLASTYQARGDFDRAEALLRDLLAARKKKLGATHPDVGQTLSALGQSLLTQRKWAEAEPFFREGLAILEANRPDDWSRFDIQSRLGGSLLGLKNYTEAKPLILTGYEGLKALEAKIPAPYKVRLGEAGERVLQLFEDWGKPEMAWAWRAKLTPPAAEARPRP